MPQPREITLPRGLAAVGAFVGPLAVLGLLLRSNPALARFLLGAAGVLAVWALVLFAVGFDALRQWSRRGVWRMTFGPISVMFSINLFLWLKPEWFHWQFAMIALGFLAKELLRWNRDGRSTHIFNPSSLTWSSSWPRFPGRSCSA